MITDFGITDFWYTTFFIFLCVIFFGSFLLIFSPSCSFIQYVGALMMIGSGVGMIFCVPMIALNDAELYNNGLQTIQDSIDTIGDIPTQSALLCQMSDIDTRQCNLDMFDWYMENHYDPTSNASMRVAMQMRGNVG
ncbi:MAG: hypothetical protein KAJ03_00470 [Gammaproteobacteria bacterium]|nr:hypothetical protein [Gammaproteobacteria bacterium]